MHFKNPFVESTEIYKTIDIFEKLTLNDMHIVLFKDIALRKPDPKKRWTRISKIRIAGADTRYPGIIYQSKLDPLQNGVAQKYCVFDGTHRISKMILEGKKSSIFFILTPEVFDGLQSFKNWAEDRTTGCNACGE